MRLASLFPRHISKCPANLSIMSFSSFNSCGPYKSSMKVVGLVQVLGHNLILNHRVFTSNGNSMVGKWLCTSGTGMYYKYKYNYELYADFFS
jgi:hypothetical protein